MSAAAGWGRPGHWVAGTGFLVGVVPTAESAVFVALGAALALLGAAMIANLGGVGEWIVEHLLPNLLRMGSVDSDRRKFGWGYLVVGLLVAVLSLSRLF